MIAATVHNTTYDTDECCTCSSTTGAGGVYRRRNATDYTGDDEEWQFEEIKTTCTRNLSLTVDFNRMIRRYGAIRGAMDKPYPAFKPQHKPAPILCRRMMRCDRKELQNED